MVIRTSSSCRSLTSGSAIIVGSASEEPDRKNGLLVLDLALLRNRDVDALKLLSGQLGGKHPQAQDSTTSSRSKEPKSNLSNSGTSSHKHKTGDHSEEASTTPKMKPWQCIVYALLTIAFIIGGLVGLYLETERLKRLGLIICLVCLLVILLAVVKRDRPENMFLLVTA